MRQLLCYYQPEQIQSGFMNIYNKAEIRFLKGRLKFGNSINSAPFPSMIVIFRRKKDDNS